MCKSAISAILALSILIFSAPSQARLIFTSGTVIGLFVSGAGSAAESVNFTMSFGPQTTGCSNSGGTNQVFVFNPTDITDAQTRKNMLALLMAARISGTPLTVDWDNAGANCDANGYPIPLQIQRWHYQTTLALENALAGRRTPPPAPPSVGAAARRLNYVKQAAFSPAEFRAKRGCLLAVVRCSPWAATNSPAEIVAGLLPGKVGQHCCPNETCQNFDRDSRRCTANFRPRELFLFPLARCGADKVENQPARTDCGFWFGQLGADARGMRMEFASDNAAGAAPSILDALVRANAGFAVAYGDDASTQRLERRFSELFERDVAVFLVSTGTAANALALAHLTPPWGTALCHAEAHAIVHECGAPEFFGGGLRLLGVEGRGGKLAPQAVAAALDRHFGLRPHQMVPGALSLPWLVT